MSRHHVALEQERDREEDTTGTRIRRFRPESQIEAEPSESPQDTLLRKILGALNRMRMMPYPASARAEKEYKAACKEYRSLYGHLTIPTSLPLRLVRRCEPQAEEQDCKVLPFCKKNGSA